MKELISIVGLKSLIDKYPDSLHKVAKELNQRHEEAMKEAIETAFEEGMFHHTNGLTPKEYYNEKYGSDE